MTALAVSGVSTGWATGDPATDAGLCEMVTIRSPMSSLRPLKLTVAPHSSYRYPMSVAAGYRPRVPQRVRSTRSGPTPAIPPTSALPGRQRRAAIDAELSMIPSAVRLLTARQGHDLDIGLEGPGSKSTHRPDGSEDQPYVKVDPRSLGLRLIGDVLSGRCRRRGRLGMGGQPVGDCRRTIRVGHGADLFQAFLVADGDPCMLAKVLWP